MTLLGRGNPQQLYIIEVGVFWIMKLLLCLQQQQVDNQVR